MLLAEFGDGFLLIMALLYLIPSAIIYGVLYFLLKKIGFARMVNSCRKKVLLFMLSALLFTAFLWVSYMVSGEGLVQQD